MCYVQAYIGDKLGYQKEPIDREMTIALTDAGAVDGADIISEVSRARLLAVQEVSLGRHSWTCAYMECEP